MFARNFGFLAGGSALGQLAYIMLSPLVTRLYDASEMGLFSIYSALVLILSPLATVRYEVALPIASSAKEKKSLQSLCLFALAISFIVSALVVYQFRYSIASMLNAEALGGLLLLLPFSILVTGMLHTFVYSSLSAKRFAQIGRSKALSPFVAVGLQVISFALGSLGLVLSQFCGRLVGVACLFQRDFVASSIKHGVTQPGEIFQTARRYSRYPLFNAPTVLTAMAGEYVPVLFLAAAYSTTTSGYYGLTVLVLALPIAVISEAIGSVYYASSKENYDNGTLRLQFLKIFEILLAVGVPAVLVLLVSGPTLFSIVFGENWGESGQIARLVAVQLLASFVAKPLATTIAVLQREREYFWFQVSLLAVRLLALSTVFAFPTYHVPVFLNACVGGAMWCCFVFVLSREVGVRTLVLCVSVLRIFVFASLAIVPMVIAEFGYAGTMGWWIGVVVSALFCLILISRVFRRASYEE